MDRKRGACLGIEPTPRDEIDQGGIFFLLTEISVEGKFSQNKMDELVHVREGLRPVMISLWRMVKLQLGDDFEFLTR